MVIAKQAIANSTGISTYSGKSGPSVTCNVCHSRGEIPSVSLSGPSTLAPGDTGTFTFSVLSPDPELQTYSGIDISAAGSGSTANAGTLTSISGQSTKILNGEVTHSAPRHNDATGLVEWSFNWIAPNAAGNYVIYGAGNSVNRDFGTDGDRAAAATWVVVVPALPTATPTVTSSPTVTPTKTISPTATSTATFTSTATQTATLTPTATFAPFGISGRVVYYSNARPVPGVDVQLDVPLSAVAITDSNGMYSFQNIGEHPWTVVPQRSNPQNPALSAIDATFALQAVVGLRTLSPDQRLAADTSGNGTISAIDATFILQYVVGLRAHMPAATACGSDWLFVPVPEGPPFPNVMLPELRSGMCQPGAVQYTPLAAPAEGQDFLGILLGDANGSWVPPASPTVTPTATVAPVGGCGEDGTGTCCNGVVDAGEECDNGGTCVGGTNHGQVCLGNSACPDGYCRAWGGDGCAVNCTNEKTVRFEFTGSLCYGGAKNGQVCNSIRTCVGGAFPGKPCGTVADCGPVANRGVCTSECTTSADGSDCFGRGQCVAGDANVLGTDCPSSGAGDQKLCEGGPTVGRPCAADAQCGTGGVCRHPCGTNGKCDHRSGAFLQAIGIIPFFSIGPFTGGQDLVLGKPGPDGLIPVAIPVASVHFEPVKVAGLFCACPSGVAAPEVHGPGNSGSGFIACGAGGMTNVNVDLSQDHNTTPGSSTNGLGTCAAGSRSGLGCGGDGDCPGSTCQNRGMGGGACVGGANKGKVCHVEGDCPGSICVSPDDPTCSAQEPPQPLGTDDAACVEKKEICTSGDKLGQPCTGNVDCGTVDTSCGTECNAQSPHQGICNSPVRLSFSGNGPTGSAVVVTNTAIGFIGPSPADDGTCKRAAVCTTFPFGQVAAPTLCQVNSECAAGKVCASAYCAGVCQTGLVGKACLRNADCGGGGSCNQGTKFSQPCAATGECGADSICQPVAPAKGFDGLPCTADDPQSSRGTPQNAPTTTGTASSSVVDAFDSNGLGHLIGLGSCAGQATCITTSHGHPFSCNALMSATQA
jgi:hypothetical protein